MVTGILFILTGFLLILYPPLLAFMVAFWFIVTGIFLLAMSRYYRRSARDFQDPFMNFFIRF